MALHRRLSVAAAALPSGDMDPSLDLSIVLPAFNEASAIGATLDDLLEQLGGGERSFELIVCADGEDGTRTVADARAARDARVRVTGGPQRRGKGRSVRDGVGQASGRTIGFMDADEDARARAGRACWSGSTRAGTS